MRKHFHCIFKDPSSNRVTCTCMHILSTFPATNEANISIQSGSERTCTVPDKMADDIHAEPKIRKRVHEEDEEDDLDLRSVKKHKVQ